MKKGAAFNIKYTISAVKHGSAEKGTGALKTINNIIRKKVKQEILKQNLNKWTQQHLPAVHRL